MGQSRLCCVQAFIMFHSSLALLGKLVRDVAGIFSAQKSKLKVGWLFDSVY